MRDARFKCSDVKSAAEMQAAPDITFVKCGHAEQRLSEPLARIHCDISYDYTRTMCHQQLYCRRSNACTESRS